MTVDLSASKVAHLEALDDTKFNTFVQAVQDGINAQTQSLICSLVLSAPQATFDTSTILGGNIPTTFTHLEIVVRGRGDAATKQALGEIRFNNDSGGNYAGGSLFMSNVDGALNAAGSASNAGVIIGHVPCATATTGAFASSRVTIPGYGSATGWKSWSGTATGYSASDNITGETFGWLWKSTAAITRITLLLTSGNWDTGSAFYLYGL